MESNSYTEEMSLFGSALVPQPAARTGDPDTSHAAANAVTRDAQSAVHKAILAVLRYGPATDGLIAERIENMHPDLPTSPSGLRSRRAELVAGGYVEDRGDRALLPTNRRAVIWHLVGRES